MQGRGSAVRRAQPTVILLGAPVAGPDSSPFLSRRRLRVGAWNRQRLKPGTKTTAERRLKQAPPNLGRTPDSAMRHASDAGVLVEAEPERLGLRTKRLDNGQDLRAARLVLGARPDPDPRRSPGQSRRLEPSSGTAGRDACAAGVRVGLEPRAGAPWRCRRIAAGIGAGRGQRPGRQRSTVGTGARHSVSPETGPETRPKPSGPQEPEAGGGPDLSRHRRAAWSSSFRARRAG